MLADQIARGHHSLADWLLLIAAILFVVELVLIYVQKLPQQIVLRLAAFALIAIALMVT